MEVIFSQIPHGVQILSVLVAVSALVSSIVPDDKMPSWLAKAINVLALNVKQAKNQVN